MSPKTSTRQDLFCSDAVRPTFLFIGPDKSGSTWLYEILRRHPHCFVPVCKDLYFFDRYYDRGIDWYLSFFDSAGPDTLACGELSHDYLFSPLAAERIARDLPGVTLLTCLRDPAQRTFSHYLYMVRGGRVRGSLGHALREYPELLDNSRYHKHLSVYFAAFPVNRIDVLYYDQLQADPVQFGRRVCESLGLPVMHDLGYVCRVLPAARPRSRWLARLAKVGANAVRDAGFPQVVGKLKRSRAAGLLYRPYADGERPRLDGEMRAQLVDLLRDDILRLQDLLQRDLTAWLATAPEVPR